MKLVDEGIYKKSNGMYLATVWQGRRRIEKTCSTIAHARKWRRDKLVEKDKGKSISPEKITLGTLVKLVISDKRNISKKHEKNLGRYIHENGGVLDFFGENTPIQHITDEAILNWRESLETRPRRDLKDGEGLSLTSVTYRLKFIKSVLNRAWEEGWLQRKPRVIFPKGGTPKKRVLNTDLERFSYALEHMPFDRKVMLWLGFYTGQRWGDLAATKWSQIEHGRIKYHQSKTGKEVNASIPEHLQTLLDELRSHQDVKNIHGYMFPNPKTGKPYTDIRKTISTACKSAGVERFTPHQIRHLFVSMIMEKTGDPTIACKRSGMTPQVLESHYDHDLGRGDRAVEELSNDVQRVLQRIPKTGT